MSEEPDQKRSLFTLVSMVAALIMGLFVIGLGAVGISGAREAARWNSCSCRHKQLALATHGYHDVNQRLPPARLDEERDINSGLISNSDPNQLSSLGPNWLVLTMPYYENQALYDAFIVTTPAKRATGEWAPPIKPDDGDTKPFRSPFMWNHNATLPDGKMARNAYAESSGDGHEPIVRCPSDNGTDIPYTGVDGNWGRGNYAINAGPCELMIGPRPSPCLLDPDGPPFGLTAAGVCTVNWGMKLERLTAADGTANTVLIAEILVGVSPDDIRGTWALGYPGASVLANAGVPNASDPNHPRADRIPDCLKVQNAVGGEARLAKLRMGCDPAAKGAEQTAARSRHPGGIMVSFCDGATHFISDKISARMWYKMLSARDGEQVSFSNE